ncbi:MAG: hypothetical protein WKG07_07335 [Hymenobacter sp.]
MNVNTSSQLQEQVARFRPGDKIKGGLPPRRRAEGRQRHPAQRFQHHGRGARAARCGDYCLRGCKA